MIIPCTFDFCPKCKLALKTPGVQLQVPAWPPFGVVCTVATHDKNVHTIRRNQLYTPSFGNVLCSAETGQTCPVCVRLTKVCCCLTRKMLKTPPSEEVKKRAANF